MSTYKMYDELVRKLRSHNGWALNETLNQAADAIEELEKKMLDWQATADEHWEAYQHWFHNYMNDIPKWIPAEERLPEKPGMYLVWLHEPTDLGDPDYSYVDLLKYDAEQGLWQNEPYAAYNAHLEFVDKVNGFYVSHWMERPMPPKEERKDPCADCVHYPPSSTDGKPCCACDPANPLTNCHEAKEETE